MGKLRTMILLLFTVSMFFGGTMVSNANTNQSVDVSLHEQWEDIKPLAVKKGDILKLTVHNNEENCLSAWYEIYSSEPVPIQTFNSITRFERNNLVAEDGVDVGDKKEVTLEAAFDGVYYVHVVRNLMKCLNFKWTTVDATFENLGQ